MRVAIAQDFGDKESGFDNEFVVVPAGEYAVTTNAVLAGVTSKQTPKLSIPFTVVGGVYPLDIGGLLEGQTLIDGKRVIGPNAQVNNKFWFNMYLRNFLILSNITIGNVSDLSGGQRKNAQIVSQELTTLGFPSAGDADDPFAYASYPMTEEVATSLIAEYLTEKYTNEAPTLRVKTEVYTYGDDNTPAVNVKFIRKYKVLGDSSIGIERTPQQPASAQSYFDKIPF